MGVTDDRNDPRLRRGVDEEPVGGQHDTYLVLSDEPTAPSESNPGSDEPEPTPEELHAPSEDERATDERATEPINELHGDQKGARGVAVHERAREMVQLRVAFTPVAEIAERYGISPGRVRAIVARELKQNRQKTAQEYRDLIEAQYLTLARPYIRPALGWTERDRETNEVVEVHAPDLKSAEFVLKCVNEIRRVQGLEKITIEYEGATQEERAAGLAGQLRAYLQGVEDAGAPEAAEALSPTNGDAPPST